MQHSEPKNTQEFLDAIVDGGLEHHPRIAYAIKGRNLAITIARVLKNLWSIDADRDLPDPEAMERLTEAFMVFRRISRMEDGELSEDVTITRNLHALLRWFTYALDDVESAMLLLPPKVELIDAAAEVSMLVNRLRSVIE